MNETSTKLLIFSAGCLTGATIAYSILKTRFEAKAAEKKEESCLCQECASNETSSGPKMMPHSKIKALVSEAREYIAVSDKMKEDTIASMPPERKTIELSEELAKQLGIISDEEETIYPITADEYGEQGYDEEQLYFYAADETLVDKDDCIVDPDETTVGDDAIDIFLYTDTENTYIRNNETKTDYEIIKVNGSYASIDSEGLYE